MQEYSLRNLQYQLLVQLHGMWRYRWHIVLVSWTVCILGWTGTFMMEDQYKAFTKVSIENPQGDLNEYLTGVAKMRFDVTSEAQRIVHNLLNQKNRERVVLSTKLREEVRDERSLEETIAKLGQQLTITSRSSSTQSVYTLTHHHSDPEVAKQVVEGFLTILMEHSVEGVKNRRQEKAQRFLSEQVQKFEDKFAKSDLAWQEFKRSNPLIRPDQGQGYYARLADFKQRAEDERLKLSALSKERDALAEQLAQRQRATLASTPLQAPRAVVAPLNEEIDRNLEQLEERILEMLETHYVVGGEKRYLYDEAHPEIRSLRNQILELQRRKEEEMARLKSLSEMPQQAFNDEKDPVAQQILLDLRKVEVDLASAQGRLQEYNAQLADLRRREATVPAKEAEYLRLKQNRDTALSKLNSILTTQGEAEFSGDVAEGLSKRVHIKVLQKPRLPFAPEGPNRPLFLVVTLLAGLGAGMTMSLFMSIMRPVYDSPSALKKDLGLPVLGTVSMADETAVVGLGARTLFMLLMISLLVIFAITMYIAR
ncbi:lipopolysaccharide biosynthesis [Magnetococcus marinus MC-1]|uniref:Lipopolysaccharide biosynthesis n=1 Tax=Magnetococcus marinus (strain ATCC BAA-1437 / JCM 17883 / MC-1) TaxID=156889 RepID=A0L563_MAGMM|nr:XrtA system polysaccharide chain length determinant [Magnetococcus marinus]ABK43106.1 lipopolysaccharide biosynthesis [Magnetococcus marinus MC-1]